MDSRTKCVTMAPTEAVDLALRHLAGLPMTLTEALAMHGAHAIDRDRSLPVVQQRRAAPEQRPVHVQERYTHVAERTNALQAALVAVDPKTGAMTAMVGGRGYGESQFNRAAAHTKRVVH